MRIDIDYPMTFITPPECRGQTVEVSYAGIHDGRVLRRTHDRSDGSITYDVADLDEEAEGDDESPIGLNREPYTEGPWRPVTEIRTERDDASQYGPRWQIYWRAA